LEFESSTVAVLLDLDRYSCDLRTYAYRRRLLVLTSRAHMLQQLGDIDRDPSRSFNLR
jgi:hypothetical protein